MDYKNKLQTNNTALEGNNLDLQTILNTINSLPEAGSGESVNLDAEITAQDAVIAQIQSALEGKAAGGTSVDTCTLNVVGSNIIHLTYITINGSTIECATSLNANCTLNNVLCNSIVGVEGVFTFISEIAVDGEAFHNCADNVGWFAVPNKKDAIIDVVITTI